MPAHHDHPATVLIIGAGKIGRGLLGERFYTAPTPSGNIGWSIVFDDIDRPLLRALDHHRAYEICHVTTQGKTTVRVAGFNVVDGNQPSAVAEAVAGADLVCTAVGARCLPSVAPVLAEGLRRRATRTDAPLDCLVCENLPRPGDFLRHLVESAAANPSLAADGPPLAIEDLEARYGFAGVVVDRAVPVPPPEALRRNPLRLVTDGAPALWVDRRALRGPVPDVPDLHLVENFDAYHQRKLMVHNMSHAVCAYLGYRAGHTLIWQALDDPAIETEVRGAMAETGRALVARFGFDPNEMRAYEANLLARYRNRALADQVVRVAADPLRKLGHADRLIGAARLCLQEGVDPEHVVRGIRAALAYDYPDDPSAVRLQQMLAEDGRAHVLREVCGLKDNDPLFERLRA